MLDTLLYITGPKDANPKLTTPPLPPADIDMIVHMATNGSSKIQTHGPPPFWEKGQWPNAHSQSKSLRPLRYCDNAMCKEKACSKWERQQAFPIRGASGNCHDELLYKASGYLSAVHIRYQLDRYRLQKFSSCPCLHGFPRGQLTATGSVIWCLWCCDGERSSCALFAGKEAGPMWRACRAVVDLFTAKVIVPFPFFSFRLLPSSDFLLPEGACLESKRSGWQSINISNFPRRQVLSYRFAFSILLPCLRACEGFIKFICAHQLSPAWQ